MAISTAAALSAGGSLITGIIGNSLNYASQENTNRANRQLAEYQNAWNLEQWNRENEYNSPLKQMERYQEAGLNPNLIYGNGVSSSGNSSTLRSADMPNQIAPKLDISSTVQSAIDVYNALRKTDAEVDNIVKDTEQKEISSTLARNTIQYTNPDLYLTLQRQKLQNDINNQNLEIRDKAFKVMTLNPLLRQMKMLEQQHLSKEIDDITFRQNMEQARLDLQKWLAKENINIARWNNQIKEDLADIQRQSIQLNNQHFNDNLAFKRYSFKKSLEENSKNRKASFYSSPKNYFEKYTWNPDWAYQAYNDDFRQPYYKF